MISSLSTWTLLLVMLVVASPFKNVHALSSVASSVRTTPRPIPPHQHTGDAAASLSIPVVLDRRGWLTKTVGSATAAAVAAASMVVAISVERASATSTPVGQDSLLVAKEALLNAIAAKAPQDEILNCIQRLVSVSTTVAKRDQSSTGIVSSSSTSSSSSSSLADRIDGKWKLIWSVGAQQFSPLLQLPFPLTPDSFQLVGASAAPVVGEGRIAQLLTSGILGPTQLYLSSGIVNYGGGGDRSVSSTSLLQIQPPFRFQVELPVTHQRLTLVEAGSDADFEL